MTQASAAGSGGVRSRRAKVIPKSLKQFARYLALRGVALLVTVVVGVYITILIANMGGYVDKIRIATVEENIASASRFAPELQGKPAEARRAWITARVEIEGQRLGLDKPFAVRSLMYLTNAMTLNLGRSEALTSDSGSADVRLIILERLPITLVLFGTASLLTFFINVVGALFLSRRYGSFLDRAVIALAPLSSAPPWFYGIFLIMIFAAILRILPWGGMVDAPVPTTTLGYSLSVLKHMILPLGAWMLSAVFIGIYAWRTFFLISASEDYVELAKAKGLTSNAIERRYILRPSLPTVITQFALVLIGAWQGAIITERVFGWPGLGSMFFRAIGAFDTPVIVASVVIFAYLLAVTVFFLDILYAILDPRVKLGAEGAQ
jgi:peptide/nickel transport system permease protein